MRSRILLILIIPLIFQGCADSQSKSQTSTITKTMSNNPNPYYSRTDTAKLNVPLSEWKKILPSDVYYVAFEKGTEPAFTGKYWDFTGLGNYYCAVCGNPLFRSDSKFASTCGWPSFFEPLHKNSVIYKPDNSYSMERTEVECGRCGAHLGHVFNDGPKPTGLRYCMNSIVLDFVPDGHLQASR